MSMARPFAVTRPKPGHAPQAAHADFRRLVELMRPSEARDLLLGAVEDLQAALSDVLQVDTDLVVEIRLEGFSPAQTRILGALVKAGGEMVPHARITGLASGKRVGRDEADGHRTAAVQVCLLRRILRARWPWARVVNVHGLGYRLDREPGHAFPWEAPASPRPH